MDQRRDLYTCTFHSTPKMSSPATEIALLPFSPGANVEDPCSQAAKSWRSIIGTVAAQEGFQRLYWGRQIESPNLVDFFVGRCHVTLSRHSVLLKLTLAHSWLQIGIQFNRTRILLRARFTGVSKRSFHHFSMAMDSFTTRTSFQVRLPPLQVPLRRRLQSI